MNLKEILTEFFAEEDIPCHQSVGVSGYGFLCVYHKSSSFATGKTYALPKRVLVDYDPFYTNIHAMPIVTIRDPEDSIFLREIDLRDPDALKSLKTLILERI